MPVGITYGNVYVILEFSQSGEKPKDWVMVEGGQGELVSVST